MFRVLPSHLQALKERVFLYCFVYVYLLLFVLSLLA